MALHERVVPISVQVEVVDGVAKALVDRFVTWETSSPAEREVITHVPGAAGAPAVGILAMKPDTRNVTNGYVTSSMVAPDGCIATVLLGENATQGAKLRIGGNSSEVDGAAYLANAQGDYIVGYAIEGGSAGEVISIHFKNEGLVP